MDRSLWFLLWLRFKGWFRRWTRNLTTTKGILLTVLGGLMFAGWISSLIFAAVVTLVTLTSGGNGRLIAVAARESSVIAISRTPSHQGSGPLRGNASSVSFRVRLMNARRV